MGEFLDLIGLPDYLYGQNILVCLIHIFLQLRRQEKQLIGILHQPLLTFVVARPRLLRLYLWR